MIENSNPTTESNVVGSSVPETKTVSETAPITLESLQKLADEAYEASGAIRRDPTKTEADRLAASQKSYAADKAVRDFVENAKKLEQTQKFEAAKTTFITDAKNNWYNAKLALDGVMASLAKIPVGKRTDEQLKNANDANENFKKLDAELDSHLTYAFLAIERKKDHPIPMGTTGAQLAKSQSPSTNGGRADSKSAKIKALLAAKHTGTGLVSDEVVNEIANETGFERKSISDIKWGWEIANGYRQAPKK